MHLTMKLELVVRKEVSYVELVKGERHTFGIQFTDGIDDQDGPVIKKVKPMSPAERCHAVCEGDVLLSLNGRKVRGMRCKNIQHMIREIGSKVDLKLQYQTRETCIYRSRVYCKQRMTTKLQKVGNSFGFVLRKRDSKYTFTTEFPVISNIKEGGPAHMDGLLQDGDRLLKVDNMSLSWLSLADIATILMEKTEAEFTFEYNMREVDFSQSLDGMVALDVDIPSVDLGIGLCFHSEKSYWMCIGSIQKGSVAERWGLFSLGDIILSVNDIDLQFLTVSKANSMLRCGSKIRKISFISTKGREQYEQISLRNCFCHHEETSSSPSGSSIGVSLSSIDSLGSEKKHLNTPASSNSGDTTLYVSHEIQPSDVCRREQVKAIIKFSDMLKHMTDLKQNLSQLTCKAFDDNKVSSNEESCTFCNKTQHSVKLCVSCISKVNVKCAQSMDLLRNIVVHFVKMSLKQEYFLPPINGTQTKNAKSPIGKAVFENLIMSLTETLPKFFNGELELQRSFEDLAHDVNKVDASCNSCKNKIDFASFTVKRLLMLISLGNPTDEINVLINQLVYCLLETKLTCDADTYSSEFSLEENSFTESENVSQSRLYPSREEQSPSEIENVSPNMEDLESEISSNSCEITRRSMPKPPRLSFNLNQQSAYFKLTDIQSVSESDSSSENEEKEAVGFNINFPRGTTHDASSDATLQMNLLEESNKTNRSKESTKSGKTIYKDKGLSNTPAKICRSFESVLNLSKSPGVQYAARNELQENSKPREIESSNEVVGECSFTNNESLKSSKVQTENETGKDKTHTETMKVKFLNEGDGFGLVIGFSCRNFLEELPVPIITTIKPNSPAYKSGILAINDRVLAINGKNIVGIPLKDLENLKRRDLISDHITLTTEFNVVDAPFQFGTFDVVLDNIVRLGLLFADRKKGSPMIVSGVCKGSPAHRSGKLFPGDKVTLLKYVRNEKLDPIVPNFTKDVSVKITVQRDFSGGIKESPGSTKPFSYNPGSNLHRGANFIVKHTFVRSAGKSGDLVLDQEVTLFRDPVSWDFGFLVGENPDTGRVYITDVRSNGPASSSGVMKKFDRIVEVNGVAIGKSEVAVPLLLSQANDKVNLLLRRLYRGNVDDASQKFHPFKFTSFL